MPALPSKKELQAELLALITRDLEMLEHAHQEAKAGATHAEAKPENDKDTRALEQSYLARGQARRVLELQTAVAEVGAMPVTSFAEDQAVALGALVAVEENGQTLMLFVAPQGGGAKLAQGTVQVVTPKSPLGRALLGKRAGDELEVRLPERLRELVLVSVA